MTQTDQDRAARRTAIETILKGPDDSVTAWLRTQHDTVLRDLQKGEWTSWQGNQGFDRPLKPSQRVKRLAKKVDVNRGKASNVIRLVLARMFQCNNVCTHEQWHILPCRTQKGTIGVIDIAKGKAFDSGVECPPEVADLGLESQVYAAANGVEGTVSFDGKVVQTEGTAVKNGEIIRPTMPPGWQQIALPTWRGYQDDGHFNVPEELYQAQPLRPTLAAYGLMTCYATAGAPCRYLADFRKGANQEWLAQDFEQIDPSWWQIDNAEEARLYQCVEEWTGRALEHIQLQRTPEEATLTPDRYPEQKVPFGKTFEERQVHALANQRGAATHKAVEMVLKTLGATKLWHARSSWTLPLLSTTLVGTLTVLVYNRLVPVAESLRWMVSFPDTERSYNVGPLQAQYEAALTAVAEQIGLAVCVGIQDHQEVLQRMAGIHLENGPRYFNL